MLKLLLITAFSSSQKAHYSYFILVFLPIAIVPILFFVLFVSGIDIQRNIDLIAMYYVATIV